MPPGGSDMKQPKFQLTPMQMITYFGPALLVIAVLAVFLWMGASQ